MVSLPQYICIMYVKVCGDTRRASPVISLGWQPTCSSLILLFLNSLHFSQRLLDSFLSSAVD